jgi:hypothetical protein
MRKINGIQNFNLVTRPIPIIVVLKSPEPSIDSKAASSNGEAKKADAR